MFVALFAIQSILGQQPKVSGDVQRFGWPRKDLHVTMQKVPVQPALALGSWAGFMANMVMGDLVLKTTELDKVVRELERGGFEISAIHNHLSGELPSVVYVHYAGHGDPDALATTLKSALSKTSTPMSGGQPSLAVHSKSLDEGHVATLHSHMLRETPRLFFMHFGGVGTPRTIAEGIKNALAKVNTK